MAFWGAVALDSAVTYRRSLEAVERAVDADPVQEIYDGPPKQPAQVQRWLLWREPTVARLRELSRRSSQMSKIAPVIAVAGPALLLAFWRRGRRDD
jgi:hypothetical protein